MTQQEYHHRLELLRDHGGQIFSVKFKRRTDKFIRDESGGRVKIASAGDLRTMRCRLHVSAGVKGVQPDRKERDENNGLVTVYEMSGEASGFKCIPVDSIIEVNGEEIQVRKAPKTRKIRNPARSSRMAASRS